MPLPIRWAYSRLQIVSASDQLALIYRVQQDKWTRNSFSPLVTSDRTSMSGKVLSRDIFLRIQYVFIRTTSIGSIALDLPECLGCSNRRRVLVRCFHLRFCILHQAYRLLLVNTISNTMANRMENYQGSGSPDRSSNESPYCSQDHLAVDHFH